MKRLKHLLLAILLLTMLLGPDVILWALEESYSYVVVTFTPQGFAAPDDFIAIYVSPTEVDLSWLKNGLADGTEIRGKIGSYPADETDGYLIYRGSDETFEDIQVNFDLTMEDWYYKAFSYLGPVYSEPAEAKVVNEIMAALVSLMTLYLPLFVLFLALLFINSLAIYSKGIFLKALACPVDIGIGLAYASTSVETAVLIAGVAIAVLGFYWLIVAAMMGFRLYGE